VSLAPGDRLGPYRIEAPLGAGGMGEVYRARDTKLDRDVAVKVLPAHLAEAPEALARFEREAKAVAALSHPGILAIHDFGRDGATSFAVMELLEGETLRHRLAGGALPLRKAVDYAGQIAQGLAAAHARGVVHRDLKPENLFVTGDGRIKILDFGLARQDTAAGRGADDTHSPTLVRATDPGTVLGTVGYMSPEQVRGHAADTRSDIFSFGAVLHEMLTGRRAFQRDTAAETMTAILKEEPAALASGIDTTAAGLPPGLARLVSRCLEKNPEERFQSARDLGFAIEAASTMSSSTRIDAMATGRSRPSWSRALPLAWLAAGAVVGALAMQKLGAPARTEPPRTRALTFSGQDRDPAASPDGRLVAFSSTRDGVSRIWIKQLQGGGEAPLTEGQDRFPRFSPDGSSVLFVREDAAGRSVYRMGLVGGEPRKVVEDAYQADWSPDGTTIAFLRLRAATPAADPAAPRRLASAVGVRELASGREQILYSPEDRALSGLRVSPDGRTLGLIEGPFVLNTRFELVLVDVASSAVRRKVAPGNPLGCLVWSGQNRIALARAGSPLGDGSGTPSRIFLLDPERGSERTLLFTSGLFPLAGTDSRSGTCDGLGPGRLVLDQIEWRMNLSEVSLGTASSPPRPLTSGNSRDRQPAYSPDGSRIVFSSNRSGNMDLWMLETRTGALRQLTDDPAQDWDPGFTPDGRHVLWSSDRSGHLEIWMAGADGSGARQVTRDGVDAENPNATPDGRHIVYTSGNPQRLGVWRIRPDGTEDKQLVAGAALVPEIAPQGRQVLVVTDGRGGQRLIRVADIETGALLPFEIEVTWPPGASNQILFGRARWTPDGRRIAFIGANAEGRSGVFVQDFVPGRDTSASRRPVAGFAPDLLTESFGMSPNGKSLVVSTLQEYSSLTLAEGLAGLEPPRR
jgi:Tol biopolymer transport system component